MLLIFRWIGVATWRWVANDDNCGICRMAFDGCCPDCKTPGDDCPLGKNVAFWWTMGVTPPPPPRTMAYTLCKTLASSRF